jgi:hypothetical protein
MKHLTPPLEVIDNLVDLRYLNKARSYFFPVSGSCEVG